MRLRPNDADLCQDELSLRLARTEEWYNLITAHIVAIVVSSGHSHTAQSSTERFVTLRTILVRDQKATMYHIVTRTNAARC